MKIAILFDTYLNDRKGLFNAIMNRSRNLMGIPGVAVDMFCLQARPAGLNSLFQRYSKRKYIETFQEGDITFRVIWYKRYLTDDALFNRLHRPPMIFRMWVKRHGDRLKDYDVITAHSARCGEMARLINKQYGTPYFVTWHGTDIHTTPFQSASLREYVTDILQSATCNFFVSRALSEMALKFAQGFRYEILYNGVSDKFYRYDEIERKSLRQNYGVAESRVVAFAGNLIPVKNVELLPEIYQRVADKYSDTLSFWIIGDGNQRKMLESSMKKRGVNCTFWGNMPPSDMPQMMNCVDVLVLPSRNESFGLVLVEAMACGANAVGSNVGGIPEVIGKENTFELGSDFVPQISERILYFLTNNIKQVVDKRFDWKETAKLEYRIYEQTCQDNG